MNVRQQDDRTVEVTVTDTGFGIPAVHLLRIFDRFYRVDPAPSQQPNPSGLGLAIVKSIMALHGVRSACKASSGKAAPSPSSCRHREYPSPLADNRNVIYASAWQNC